MVKQNVLVVDDSAVDRDMLAAILSENYTVYTADSGIKAIKMLEEGDRIYCMMLLDFCMPEMSGLEVLKYLNKSDSSTDIPIMIISADENAQNIAEAYELGAVDYFVKPFNKKIILGRIGNFLRWHEVQFTDSVTGGCNRKGFINLAKNILSKSSDLKEYAIFHFNIKNFKVVNEIFGLEGGDIVLKEFYNSLLASDLEPLVASRLEADNFVCLARKSNMDMKRLASRMDSVVNVFGKNVRQFARCGIYMIDTGSVSVDRMIDYARIALHHIVDENTQPYAFFTREMLSDYVNQAETLSEYEDGMVNNEFKPYYQPVVDAQTGKLVSAEALIRWQHPQKGFISPGVFIPALEKNGFISKLDWFMARRVYGKVWERLEAGELMVPISINLSWMDFYDADMIEQGYNLISNLQALNNNVRIEITETSYAALESNHMDILEKIRNLGVKIYLDDFGSGYSSFGMIQSYNFDIVKLDMSFIQKIRSNNKTRSIIKSVIEMCHNLGVKVVAEGVETKEELEFLRENACDYIQGYYFSKPLSEEAFIEYLDQAIKNNMVCFA